MKSKQRKKEAKKTAPSTLCKINVPSCQNTNVWFAEKKANYPTKIASIPLIWTQFKIIAWYKMHYTHITIWHTQGTHTHSQNKYIHARTHSIPHWIDYYENANIEPFKLV